MKAIGLRAFDGVGAIDIVSAPKLKAGAGEVLVRIEAAAANPADWKLCEGWLNLPPNFPYVLGFDGAGTVVETGDGVDRARLGRRVAVKTAVGRGGAGAFAEVTCVPQHLARDIPDAMSFTQAAALPTAGITAWESVFHVGQIKPGQTIFIHGAAGGVGGYAVGLARMAGARVIASARADNLDYLRALGAHAAFDDRSGGLAQAVLEGAPKGVDVLIDAVGLGVLKDPLRYVKDDGALIFVETLIPRADTLAQEGAKRGVRVETATSNRDREGDQLAALIASYAEGALAWPEIETMPIAAAARAIARIKQGGVRGKLVFTCGERDWS